MDIKSINTKSATITVEIELSAMRALRSYLEQEIGHCEVNGKYDALKNKYKTQHHDIQNALDEIRRAWGYGE